MFPVIVAKARKYYLRVKQILEWHNRIEATMIRFVVFLAFLVFTLLFLCSEIEYTTDDECKAAVGPKPAPGLFTTTSLTMAAAASSMITESTSAFSSYSKPSSSPSAMDTTPERAEPILPESLTASPLASFLSSSAAAPKPSTTFPLFAIDFVSRRNIWEGKGKT